MKTRIVCFVLIAGAALAQEPAPLKLTLKDAVSLALKQNPNVILANLNVSQSQQDVSVARSGLLPQMGGNVNETVHRFNLQALIGLPSPVSRSTSARTKPSRPASASTRPSLT